MRKSRSPERDVLNAVRLYLEWHGARVERLNSGAVAAEYHGRKRYIRFSFPGCPDLVALTKSGHTMWIECKRPGGGKLSGPQAIFREDCLRRGIPHVVARSIEDVAAALRALGEAAPGPAPRSATPTVIPGMPRARVA